MNKKIFIKTILAFVLLAAILISGISVYGILSQASEKARKENITDAVMIKNKLERLADICTAEYSYNEIITDRSTGFLGLDPKAIIIMIEGKIKAGCRLVAFEGKNGKYSVVLSKPYIMDGHAEIVNEVPRNGFFRKYEMSDDKEMADKAHKKIEDKVRDELFYNAEKNTRDVVLELLNNLGIKGELIEFTFV